MQNPTGLRRAALTATVVMFWLVAAGVVVQVFLAGLAIFGGETFETHEDVGWMVHTLAMISILLAIAGPRTRLAILGAIGLAVLNTVQVLLSQADAAGLAALHPTLALAVLGLALWLATRVRAASASATA